MDALGARLVAALAFVVGVGGGGALAVYLRGGSIRRGRRCAACDASLSPVAALPGLSWFGVRRRCRHCGTTSAWRPRAVETGVVLIGGAAILALPIAAAVPVAAAGWLGFVLLLRRSG